MTTEYETIRFEMDNKGEQPHEFEVLDPDGGAVGEIAGNRRCRCRFARHG